MTRRVLVAGIGNIFLSDDGFGSEVARRLITQVVPDGVAVVDYGIRGMHLAYDLLDGYDALVIIDTLPHRAPPGDLVVLEIGPDDVGEGDFDAHGMEPTAVLASLGAMGGTLPPTFVIGCEPACLDEGIGLSPAVDGAVEAALRLTRELLETTLARVPPAARLEAAAANQHREKES
ncbi:MAG: hydrogenase maturation protease [Actinomycetota bacterium]|nr:hydrogenase maturation protease [Actinomycetota bacterium]